MRKSLLIFKFILALTMSAAGQADQNNIVFLDQTRIVPGKLEWNREITAEKDGSISIRITVKGGGKFSVLLIKDEDYQVITRKKPTPENFRLIPLINIDASNSFEKTIALGKGTYWFIIENQEETERSINLICSEIR